MYLIIGLDKAGGCKQTAFEKHSDVSHIHLDASDIHLKFALNSHAHPLDEHSSCKLFGKNHQN